MHTPRLPPSFIRWLLVAALWFALPLRADETTRQVQEELRKRDLYFGNVDGCTSPQVAAALRSYQQRKGFPSTGQLDETTLRSLHLLPALATGNGAASPSAPGFGSAASPWPDITILRSDEARRSPDAPGMGADGDAVASPTPPPDPLPTPGPPPAAAHRERPNIDAVRLYIESYLQAGQTNDTEAELRFYADRVDYYDTGVMDQHFIRGDVNRYDHRWPERHFTLLGPLTLSDAPDGDPEKVVAHFRFAFTNKGPRYTVEGKVDDAFTLQRTGPDSFRIVGMKEQRVREK